MKKFGKKKALCNSNSKHNVKKYFDKMVWAVFGQVNAKCDKQITF